MRCESQDNSGYIVEARDTTGKEPPFEVGVCPANQTSFDVEGLRPGVAYMLRYLNSTFTISCCVTFTDARSLANLAVPVIFAANSCRINIKI